MSAVNGEGWEVEMYDRMYGWHNPFNDKEGFPLVFSTKEEADFFLAEIPIFDFKHEYRVYETLSVPKKRKSFFEALINIFSWPLYYN